jgi:hypothetical protein
MLVGYIIDYVQIYYREYVFYFFEIKGALELGSQKHFPL